MQKPLENVPMQIIFGYFRGRAFRGTPTATYLRMNASSMTDRQIAERMGCSTITPEEADAVRDALIDMDLDDTPTCDISSGQWLDVAGVAHSEVTI